MAGLLVMLCNERVGLGGKEKTESKGFCLATSRDWSVFVQQQQGNISSHWTEAGV